MRPWTQQKGLLLPYVKHVSKNIYCTLLYLKEIIYLKMISIYNALYFLITTPEQKRYIRDGNKKVYTA